MVDGVRERESVEMSVACIVLRRGGLLLRIRRTYSCLYSTVSPSKDNFKPIKRMETQWESD